MLDRISASRTYIAVLESVTEGFQIIQYTLPPELKNTSSVACNSFHRVYLQNTPLEKAGLLVSFMPIEALKPQTWEDYLTKIQIVS